MTFRDFIIHLIFYISGFFISVLIISAAIYWDILSSCQIKIFPFLIGIFLSICSICGLIKLIHDTLKKES